MRVVTKTIGSHGRRLNWIMPSFALFVYLGSFQFVAAEMPRALPAGAIDRAKVAGTATVRWLGFRVFDAVLVTPDGKAYSPAEQAALQLQYGTAFTREELLTATMKELDRLEGTRSDHPEIKRKLQNCFANVGTKDRFLAVGPASNQITLFRNQTKTCDLRHPGIRARFLDIWLSPNSRFPSLSRKLRG